MSQMTINIYFLSVVFMNQSSTPPPLLRKVRTRLTQREFALKLDTKVAKIIRPDFELLDPPQSQKVLHDK